LSRPADRTSDRRALNCAPGDRHQFVTHRRGGGSKHAPSKTPEEQTNSSSALALAVDLSVRPSATVDRDGAIIDDGAVAGSETAEIAAASISEGIMLRATAVFVCFSSPHIKSMPHCLHGRSRNEGTDRFRTMPRPVRNRSLCRCTSCIPAPRGG